MNARSPFPLVGFAVLALVLCVGLSGCGGSKVSKANYDKVSNDMTEAQVKDILGNPSKTQGAGPAQQLIWENGNDTITVVFVNGKVSGKLSSYDLKAAFGQ